jgi:hypothetical protein
MLDTLAATGLAAYIQLAAGLVSLMASYYGVTGLVRSDGRTALIWVWS